MKKFFVLIFMFISAFAAVAADGIAVKVNQRIVKPNESFTVIFSSRHQIQEQPDFTPLLDDFDILSKHQNVNATFINGVISQEASWTLNLMAKRSGELVIPSIQFGDSLSLPQTIQVTDSPPEREEESVFVTADLEPRKQVYEQTQLIYTVRLHTAVKLTQAALSEIKLNDPDATIEKLGQDREYEYYHENGKLYSVYERKYAVFPQHAGELIFSPIVFEGRVVANGRSFLDFHTGQFKRAASNEVKVEVHAIPAPFQTTNWLAANEIKLTEEWSGDPNQVMIGEPITWTLTFTADGCHGNQLPEFTLNLPKALKYYLDKPEISNQTGHNGIISQKQIKAALIPTAAGQMTIPAIQIPWWDLKADQMRTAQLPERVIHIIDPQIAMAPPVNETSRSQIMESPLSQENSTVSPSLPIWAWCLIGLNAIWIVALFYLLYKKMRFKDSPSDSLRKVKRQLKGACQANDAKQAEKYLLAWAAILFPQEKILNVIEMKKHLSENLTRAIDELYQTLYGQEKTTWQGKALWQAIAAFKPTKAPDSNNNPVKILNDLYS